MDGSKPRIDLRPGPFFSLVARRLDLRSRRGFPVTVALVAAAAMFGAFLSIAEEMAWATPSALDHVASRFLVRIASERVTDVMWLLTLMGDTRVVLVESLVAALLMAVWGHPRRAGSLLVLVGSGSAVAHLLKGLFGRVRPDEALALLVTPDSASFPSGHAIAGMLLFGSLALMLSASRVSRPLRTVGASAVLMLGLMIGVSRVYLGVHFLSDVLASWFLGASLVLLWAAAVLMWGRAVSPQVFDVENAFGKTWWRWALTALGLIVVAAAIYAEMPLTPLR